MLVASPIFASEPIGYVRTVRGIARLVSPQVDRPAEPLAAIWSDDTVVVDSESVTVCDLRTGQTFEVQAPSSFRLPAEPESQNAGLHERLLHLLRSLSKEPEQRAAAAVRGRTPRRAWPHNAKFAPAATIEFRWSETDGSGRFELRRGAADSRLVWSKPNPMTPLAWPPSVAQAPGRYKWRVRDKAGKTVVDGRFIVLSPAQVRKLRKSYAARATAEAGTVGREREIELLAAQDQVVLQ